MRTAHNAKYRHRLPQLNGGRFLTDGGLETTLIFHEGWDLPMFESFVLIDNERGRSAFEAYFDRYIRLAISSGVGFIVESPTWRANPDWGARLGYDRRRLASANRRIIELMMEVRDRYETAASPIVISGCIGPRGDGYDAGQLMSEGDAQAYHGWQIEILRETAADLVSAMTMTNIPEAIGVARAAQCAGLPSVISFTLETDGRLPSGSSLADAVDAVDQATDGAPAYYMINCAHPTHFADTLQDGAAWVSRIKGLRANASKRSHAELDNAPDLDAGDPEQLGQQYAELLARLPHITVLGGCCGTDHRHVASISAACGHGYPRAAA